MTVWLAEKVGEGGKVVATDIDVTYLKRIHLPNLEVRQHNILNDSVDALGPGSFDMVCSRLTLFLKRGFHRLEHLSGHPSLRVRSNSPALAWTSARICTRWA